MLIPSAAFLRVSEIFYSLQGESTRVGYPTVFIRLTGCPLRCVYCDTEYAFHGGQQFSLEQILKRASRYRSPYVTITGGEPLAQPHCVDLVRLLCDEGRLVSLETSGALDISAVDKRACVVMDVKTPSSREEAKNQYSNFAHLNAKDEIKFVLMNGDDYVWAKQIIERYQLDAWGGVILFSPVYGQLEPKQLAEWVLADQLPVRVQIQLHKLLWGEEQGH